MTTQQLEREHSEAVTRYRNEKARIEVAGYTPTPSDVSKLNGHVLEVNDLKRQLDRARSDAEMTSQIARLTGGDATTSYGGRRGGLSLGAQFIDSDTYKWLKEHRHRLPAGVWTSPSAELGLATSLMAATLSEDAASGGALIVPDYRPVVWPLVPTVVVADLIAPGTTTSNLVTYPRETAATVNAADTVLEGAPKPESTLGFEPIEEHVRKIATWVPVTEEMYGDQPQTASYIDMRLRQFVLEKENDQLLNGTGVAPDLLGFLARPGLAPAVARGTDTNADAILKQIQAIASTTGEQPSGLVIHPTNWATMQLAKDTQGNYIGNGPFAAPQTPVLWGVPVAITKTIAAGTALVGAFRGASQIFRNGGVRVEATNSHADFFVKNLWAIRAEERLALAVYHPSAFGTVTGLN
jgi:HK97 family phage major capsid protein